jgi:hypothetical protein
MTTITEMITAAQERRAKQIADVDARRKQEQQEGLANFRSHLNELFGELPALFDMTVECNGYDSFIVSFSYQGRPYRMSEGRNAWYLRRIEKRDQDDERELPNLDFYAHYHNGERDNQDNFLLALIELSERPDTPRRAATKETKAPEPTLEERLVETLREFIRTEAPNYY